jgi:Zn-dependent M28 family amino/carboxypeptidase
VDPAAVRAAGISARIRFLSDDLLEGRFTGSRGHAIAERYVASELQAMGVEPGADDGTTFFQAVPMRAAEADSEHSSLVVRSRGKPDTVLKPDEDFFLFSDVRTARVDVEAPLVFAGYGLTAPEYGYDDLAGLDLKGKIAIIFLGAPLSDKDDFFPSTAHAIYSATRAKIARLAARGAAGVISVYRPVDEERRPWERVIKTSHTEQMSWTRNGEPGTSAPGATLRGAIAWKTFDAILARAGVGWSTASLDAAAATSSGRLKSFEIPASLHGKLTSKLRDLVSHNVVGILRGSDPKLLGEYVVYSAHLDHLGIAAPIDGDSVYNGAIDNASGTASILEIARAFSLAPKRPARSILFLLCTGEERGELGSDYFAQFPTVPSGSIVADFNDDMVLSLGPVHDVVSLGAEHSSLGPLVTAAAATLGLKTSPDPEPQQINFIRSDQYSFVRQGIPSVVVCPGLQDAQGRTEDYAQRRKTWMATRYHAPQDEWDPGYDYEGMAQVARVELLGGLAVANAAQRPSWNDNDVLGRMYGKK